MEPLVGELLRILIYSGAFKFLILNLHLLDFPPFAWLNALPSDWWYLGDYFCLVTHQVEFQEAIACFSGVFPAVGDALPDQLAANSDRSSS